VDALSLGTKAGGEVVGDHGGVVAGGSEDEVRG
jgi:hypothetical protein